MKITASSVRALALPEGKQEAFFWDSQIKGLAVRLRAGGSKTLVFQYRIAGRQGRINLGNADALDIGQARDRARELYAKVHLGIDPAAETARAKIDSATTFEALMRRYLGRQRAVVRPATYRMLELHLLRYASSLHRLPVAQITRRDIAAVLAEIAERSGGTSANRLRGSLSSFFAWGIGEGLLDTSPIVGTNRVAERPRDRALLPTEIAIIWKEAGAGDFADVLRLLALTTCRAAEIGGLRWDEVDLERRELILPPQRTKSARTHSVPLSQLAAAILEARPRRAGSAYVFGRIDGRPFGGWSGSKARLDERVVKAFEGMPEQEIAALRTEWHRRGYDTSNTPPAWLVHDIRRSAATLMAEKLAIQPHVIEAVLGHTFGTRVARTYNRSDYATEKRHALDAWGAWLTGLVEGREQTVLPFRREA